MPYVLHTPARGDGDLLRMLKAGLEDALKVYKRHTAEHLSGGRLDLKTMSADLQKSTWCHFAPAAPSLAPSL